MSKADILRKLYAYKKNPELIKEVSNTELADLVVIVLTAVQQIEEAIKAGRLDGKTPEVDKDYLGKESTMRLINNAVRDILSGHKQLSDKAQFDFDKTSREAVSRLQQGLNGKDAEITDEHIQKAAKMAFGLIELPDFEKLITEQITGKGTIIRDAISSLKNEDRYKVEIADVEGLASALSQISQIRSSQGGGIGKNQVYSFIREAIADGTITTGGAGSGDVVGPASAVDDRIATFDGITGKLIQDGGKTVAEVLSTDNHTNGTTNKVFTATEQSKLSGIATSANNYVHPNHSGDVTSVADGATTIANDAVTYAKMQNVSATSRVLGRITAGAGDVEELTGANIRTIANVEDGADVTDATNVTAAGALMDSELTDIAAVKALADGAASDVNTGTSTSMFVTPDALAGSNLGTRYISCALNGTTALTTSEKYYFRIPAALTGMNLVSVSATVGTGAAGSSSSGTPTFTVKNVTDNQQMLSTSLTVDANEYTSATAATAAVINTTYDDVATDDLIEVAVTTAGTGVTYAVVTLGFQLP